ncbi:60S ribosomal protein L26A [Spiromyces aspiralis]|uniref:60S ribosomal protein L26A n=1 Tax=Spiromyces aspiralis TaxID=68401 RepID=A0ACC1HJ93_9FUNG|nr:60S ribosomal protein L26A [Spiromyces aspiralis]
MATRGVQDIPPKGGYPEVKYNRVLPKKGPTGIVFLGMITSIMGYGWYKIYQGVRERRELVREKTWSRIHLIPLLQAESDRDDYRRLKAAEAREGEIMKDIPGWKVGEDVTSSRRKARKAHFGASGGDRHRLMSATLKKELREKYGVRALPIRKHDEVVVLRGEHKGKEGEVTAVYRKKWVIHIKNINREKVNGSSVPVGIHPSNVAISKVYENKDRLAIIDRKAEGRKASAAARQSSD